MHPHIASLFVTHNCLSTFTGTLNDSLNQSPLFKRRSVEVGVDFDEDEDNRRDDSRDDHPEMMADTNTPATAINETNSAVTVTTAESSDAGSPTSTEDVSNAVGQNEGGELVNDQDFFDQHNDHCDVCNQPGELLCCASCTLVFHIDCLLPKLIEEPPDDWRCAHCWRETDLRLLLAEQRKVLDNITPMGHRLKNNTEENLTRAQRIDALVGHQALLSVDGMFAVPPFPLTNHHFVPRLSKTKFHYKGFGIINSFIETNVEATGEEVDDVKKPSISNVKQALVENGATIKDDVMLREIGREIMDYYLSNNKIKDNYILVILSSRESLLARTSDKKTVEIFTSGTDCEKASNYKCLNIAEGVLKGEVVTRKKGIHVQRIVYFTFCDEKVIPWMHHGQIDHINCNRSDNRFVNLRYVTARENCGNRFSYG